MHQYRVTLREQGPERIERTGYAVVDGVRDAIAEVYSKVTGRGFLIAQKHGPEGFDVVSVRLWHGNGWVFVQGER